MKHENEEDVVGDKLSFRMMDVAISIKQLPCYQRLCSWSSFAVKISSLTAIFLEGDVL